MNEYKIILQTDSETNEWLNDCCLMPTEIFSAISWQEQVAFRWDNDDDVHFVQDHHPLLDFYSASSPKQ